MILTVVPNRVYGDNDNKEYNPLITPDNAEDGWAIRYLWVQHLNDNDNFYNNYFDIEKKQTGLNIRKQTADLVNDWNKHNQIFLKSHQNGDLVWRLKAANKQNKSIDYIEIWKDRNTISKYFPDNANTKIDENIEWDKEAKLSFNRTLYDKGFDIRYWIPNQQISKWHAMCTYKKFIDLYNAGEKIIFNSWWKRDLNPYQ